MDRALKEPGTEKTSWRPSWLSSAVSVVETPPLVSVPVIEAAALPADEAVSVGQFSLLTRNLLQIVANLDLQSLAAMSRTSRQWNNFIRRTEILEHHCINHFIDDVSRQWLNIGQTRWQSPELREILAKKNLAEKQNMLSDFFARFENIYFPPWKGVPLIENLAGEYYRRRFGPSNQGQTSSQNRLAHSEPESIDSLACSVPKGRDSIPCEAPLGTPDSTSSHDSQISELLNEIILKTQNPNLAPVKQFVAIDNLELKRKIFFEKCMTDRVIAKYKAIPMFEKLVADYSEK